MAEHPKSKSTGGFYREDGMPSRTHRAVEALAVVVVVEGLDPPVAGLDGKAARDALGREQFVPVLFAVGQPVLEVEGRVGEDLAAVGAHEALGVERPAHRLQAVLST